MTTYTWPTGDSAFSAARITFGALHNSRQSVSELNGATQGISLPGMRRKVTIDLPRQTYDERRRVSGFLARLNGREHRVALWDLANPTPMRLIGTPTVSGALAQFATTLNVAGTLFAAPSILQFSQDMTNSLWSKQLGGVAVAPVVVGNDGAAPDGSVTADKVTFSLGGGTTSTDRSDLVGNGCTIVTGNAYTFVWWAKSADASTYVLRVDFGGTGGGLYTITPAWQRFTAQVTSAVSAGAKPFLRLRGGTGSSSTAVIHVWGAALFNGLADLGDPGLPALNPGDWISLPTSAGDQLCEVVNAVAGETLTGVEIRPALRGTVANGAAVGITKPTALYVLAEPDAVVIPRAGSFICPEMSFDLVEVFS